MLTRPSQGVSPIIATLLLIAITVAAGVIVYVFVSGTVGTLTQGGGQQTGEQVELTSYAFTPITGTCDLNTSLTAPCVTVTLKDAGASAVTIDAIYFNGLPLTEAAYSSYHGGVFQPITLATHQDVTIQLSYGGTFSSYEGYTGLPSSVTGGSAYPLKIVTVTGGLFSYTLIAGSAQ